MKTPKDYIIFPLDVATRDEALVLVDRLKEDVGLFKVGLELFISQGPGIVRAIRNAGGTEIFLDLKLHDIPATVQGAFMAASALAPRFITVHCDEGGGVLSGVAEAGGTRILAVTVLTSLDAAKLEASGHDARYAHNISDLVLLRARLARDAGCHGIVCSGQEVGRVREALGRELIAVTPGIRPAWSLIPGDDQRRIVTPAQAVQAGSDFIVVGRPIRDAPDPAAAARRVADEIAAVL